MKKFQIIILGASTTHGNWDEEGGWAERIRSHTIREVLMQPDKLVGHVFNLGVPGDTTVDLLERFDNEVKARLFYEETMIIVSVGTNDSKIVLETGEANISQDTYTRNIDQLIKKGQNYSKSILFLGLAPVDETRTDPWRGKDSFKNISIQKYNDITKTACLNYDIPFINLFSEFTQQDYLQYISEGLHPNSLGHEKIFCLAKPYVDEFLHKS